MKKITLLFLQIIITLLLSMPLTLMAQTFPNPANIISNISGSTSGNAPHHLSDLDGDGDLDAISSRGSQFSWYKNLDGLGSFGPNQSIDPLPYYSHDFQTADLDNDGDMDLITIGQGLSSINWYENIDGLGTFGSRQVIVTQEYGILSLFIADIDDDGDMDLLSASFGDNRIAWYENTDGLGTFGPKQTIFTAPNYFHDVYAADIDNDGDMDVLSASRDDDRIAWYENTDGLGTFGPQQTITNLADEAAIVFAVDMDGDLDKDVLSASFGDNRIAWYENIDGLGTFGSQQIIPSANEYNLRDIFPTDIDGDGDIDVVSVSKKNTTDGYINRIAWNENINCLGTFNFPEIIPNPSLGFSDVTNVSAGDIDMDGDMDVVTSFFTNSRVFWHENTTSLISQPVHEMDLPSEVYVCDKNFEEFCGPSATTCYNYTYNWYYNDPITQTPNLVTNSNPNDQCYTPNQYGNYTLVIENQYGFFLNHVITVLNALPLPSLGSGNEICKDEIISIAGQGFDNSNYEITWYHNGQEVQSGGETLITSYASGIITVQIASTECKKTVAASIEIKDCCPKELSLALDCDDNMVFIENLPNNSTIVSTSWTYNGGHILHSPKITSLNASYGEGTYGVEIVFELSNGDLCIYTLEEIYSNLKINCPANKQIKTAPNPFIDIISFTFDTPETGKVEIVNIYGRVMKQKEFKNKSTLKFHLRELRTGVYFVRFYIDGNTYNKQIIKQ